MSQQSQFQVSGAALDPGVDHRQVMAHLDNLLTRLRDDVEPLGPVELILRASVLGRDSSRS